MNRLPWLLVVVLAVGLAAQFLSTPVRSQDAPENPFVGVAFDGEGRWTALRANGEVYVSAGRTWLDPMEYRYTIKTLEELYPPQVR